MTIVADFCSQTILQKSFTVSCLGPIKREDSLRGKGRRGSLKDLGLHLIQPQRASQSFLEEQDESMGYLRP